MGIIEPPAYTPREALRTVGSVFTSVWQTVWYPSVILPSTVASLGALFAFKALGVGEGFWVLPQSTMPWVVVVLGAQFWAGLCVTATAVQILRSDGRLRSIYWVPATVAFQAALVSMGLTLAILVGFMFLVIPGLLLSLRWSQAMLLILDGRAEWFESAGQSEVIVYGHKLEILFIWVLVGHGFAVFGWLSLVSTDISLAIGASWLVPEVIAAAFRVAIHAFGFVVVAAVYHELTPDWALDRTD
jgi:hypothetical protein